MPTWRPPGGRRPGPHTAANHFESSRRNSAGVGHRQLRCEIGELGNQPARRTGRRAQLSRSRQRLAFARRPPRPPVRREDAVVVAALRVPRYSPMVTPSNTRRSRPRLLAGEAEAAHPISRIAADVLTDEDGLGPASQGQPPVTTSPLLRTSRGREAGRGRAGFRAGGKPVGSSRTAGDQPSVECRNDSIGLPSRSDAG